MADYLPEGDEPFRAWLQNFVQKLALYAATFGITAAEVTAVVNDLALFEYLLDGLIGLKPAMQAWSAYKTQLRRGRLGSALGTMPTVPPIPDPPAVTPLPGIEARVRSLAQRIKAHTAYTQAIGEDLGIVAPESAPSPAKPTATLTALPNSQVQVDWVKRGYDGVYVEGQRAGETEWTRLGQDMQSPFLDTRPPLVAGQPEQRRYRLRYFKGDAPTGAYSDIMTVTTEP